MSHFSLAPLRPRFPVPLILIAVSAFLYVMLFAALAEASGPMKLLRVTEDGVGMYDSDGDGRADIMDPWYQVTLEQNQKHPEIGTRLADIDGDGDMDIVKPWSQDQARDMRAAQWTKHVIADVAPYQVVAVADISPDAGVINKWSLGGGKGPSDPPPSQDLAIGTTGFGSSPALTLPPVHDPVSDPGGFLSDVKGAARTGWPLGAMVALLGIMIGAQSRIPKLREPGTRLAAGWTSSIAIVGTTVLRFTGVIGTTEYLGVLGMAITLFVSPHAKMPDTSAKK